VFEHIGVIAGMEGVTIIHGCSCEGREVYLLPAGKSGVGDRADTSSIHSGNMHAPSLDKFRSASQQEDSRTCKPV
jgi:hypothetical protein